MGRKSRMKRERRQAKAAQGYGVGALPPCSFQKCANGRPPGTHVIKLKDGIGTFYTACDDCIEPMMHALKIAGKDAQVFTAAALAQLNKAARKKAAKTAAERALDHVVTPEAKAIRVLDGDPEVIVAGGEEAEAVAEAIEKHRAEREALGVPPTEAQAEALHAALDAAGVPRGAIPPD